MGDRLRRKIDEGLKRSRFGLLGSRNDPMGTFGLQPVQAKQSLNFPADYTPLLFLELEGLKLERPRVLARRPDDPIRDATRHRPPRCG